jgi:uncharacterized protein YjiS (DUF1127 family)
MAAFRFSGVVRRSTTDHFRSVGQGASLVNRRMPTMTNANATPGRSRASALQGSVDAGLGRVGAAWKQYRSYRRTLAELRGLSSRVLRDLDFHRGDLSAIARREVYGH